jgi:hypothetical protein
MMPLLRHGELSRMRDAHRPGRPAAVMTIEDEILPSVACGG